VKISSVSWRTKMNFGAGTGGGGGNRLKGRKHFFFSPDHKDKKSGSNVGLVGAQSDSIVNCFFGCW
jgi:hypothetical protein